MEEKKDEQDIFNSRVYSDLTGSAYFFNKKSYVQVVCLNIILTIKKGVSIDSAFILMQTANIFLTSLKSYKFSKKISDIGIKLLDRFEHSSYHHQTMYIHLILLLDGTTNE